MDMQYSLELKAMIKRGKGEEEAEEEVSLVTLLKYLLNVG